MTTGTDPGDTQASLAISWMVTRFTRDPGRLVELHAVHTERGPAGSGAYNVALLLFNVLLTPTKINGAILTA